MCLSNIVINYKLYSFILKKRNYLVFISVINCQQKCNYEIIHK